MICESEKLSPSRSAWICINQVWPEASSIMRALSGARYTDIRLYTLWIKIGTNQRALGEHSHYWTRLCFRCVLNGTCIYVHKFSMLHINWWTLKGNRTTADRSLRRVTVERHGITFFHLRTRGLGLKYDPTDKENNLLYRGGHIKSI